MLNLVALMGRIARTPEVKKGKDGKDFTITAIAVPNGLNADGTEKVMFVDLVCYNDGQKAFDYVNTGDQVGITGRLDVYTFAKKDGSTGYGTRVVVSSIEFGAKKASQEENIPSPKDVGIESPKEAPKAENPRNRRR